MKKRFVAGLVLVCLVLGVFAGCGNDTETLAETAGVTTIESMSEITTTDATSEVSTEPTFSDLGYSEEDVKRALEREEVKFDLAKDKCRPVVLNGEAYIAYNGYFLRLNPNADNSVYPHRFPYPDITVTLTFEYYQNGWLPIYNKPEYVLGAKYDEITYVPQEMKDAAIELTGVNTVTTREATKDGDWNLGFSLENVKYANISIRSAENFSELYDNSEPNFTLNLKNIDFSEITIKTERVNLEIIESNNYTSSLTATVSDAGFVKCYPNKITDGEIILRVNDVKTLLALPESEWI
jgi:hypothetical protein